MVQEPLLQFLVLGGGVFLLFSLINDRQEFQPEEIVVSAGQIERMSQAWRKTRLRPPTQQELEGLIKDYIQEEVYYREALVLGLDQDNSIIRRHLRQKMEFLSADIAAQKDPEEAELQMFLHANPDRFREDAHFRFRHIFFNRDTRGEAAADSAYKVLATLIGTGSATETSELGDPWMLPRKIELASERDISDIFGRIFVKQLLSLDTGQWSGPIESGFGLHLVFIDERIESKVPPLDSIRDAVVREWREARRQDVNAAFYEGLRQRYSVIIERPEFLDAKLNIDNVVQR